MSEDQASVLASARRGLSPTSGDAERVHAAIQLALRVPATMPHANSEALSKPLRSLLRWGRPVAALALATATGAGGYALGFRAGRAERVISAPRVVVAPPPTVMPVPRVETPAPLRPLPELPAPPARPGRSAIEKSLSPAPSSIASSSSAESPLELETRLLTRVERALRDDNPRLALGLLGELDREVPGGQLAEERRAARVIAHCELGTASAPELARDFLARYASSAYRARIETACKALNDAASRE